MATVPANSATLKTTFRAALGMASQSFNTVTATVDMADRFVGKAASNQRKRYAKEAHIFNAQLAHELARETAELKRQADDYVDQHKELAELYTTTHNDFLAELKAM